MLDQHALRVAGGARGVDDVAGLVGRRRDLVAAEPGGGLHVDRARRAVEVDQRHREGGERAAERRHRHDGGELRVAGDEADALGREAGVERHIGGVELEHREHRHIGLDGAVEQEADAVARLDPLLGEVARHLVGAGIELRVGDRRLVGHHRVKIGEAVGAALEQVIEPVALLGVQREVLALAGEDLAVEARRDARVPAGAAEFHNSGSVGEEFNRLLAHGSLVCPRRRSQNHPPPEPCSGPNSPGPWIEPPNSGGIAATCPRELCGCRHERSLNEGVRKAPDGRAKCRFG